MVSTIINMAKLLGMDVIAEGVENVKQLNFLKHMGCKYIQGFYFSKPVFEEEFFKKDFEDRVLIHDDTDKINVESIFTIRNPESLRFCKEQKYRAKEYLFPPKRKTVCFRQQSGISVTML